MFGKSDEKWIEIAFGEQKLPDDFSTKNADDAEILKSYELLREDLQLLKDIPEMQFSNERLRDAILAAGPKANAQSSWVMRWGWTVAPVAAMLAMGVVLLKGNFSAVEPRVIVSPGSLQSSEAVASKVDVSVPGTISERSSQNTVGIVEKTIKPEIVASETRPKGMARRKLARSNGVRLAMATTPVVGKKALDPVTSSVRAETVSLSNDSVAGTMSLTRDADSNQSTVSADAMMAPARGEASSNVILIDASSDSVTGLPNATEVSKNSEKVALGG